MEAGVKDFANLLLDEFMSATSNNGSGGAAFIVAVAAERPSLWADADLLILDVVICDLGFGGDGRQEKQGSLPLTQPGPDYETHGCTCSGSKVTEYEIRKVDSGSKR